MDKYKSSHGILTKQKYKFPNDFLKIDKVEKEWNSFKQILKQKSDAMEEQIPGIKSRIYKEIYIEDYSVDELYNKPTNQLTVNETKAIALCDKTTYQDCYDFYLEYEKNYRQSFEDNAKKLNIDPDKRREKDIELEDIELYGKCRNLTRQEVLNKLQNKDKYHNILFLIETTIDF